ncbi:MAG: hypothetical protein HC828_14595, partial [Blastochloris sp.]|nr:hypothetical protein [Blastochloris sp.]
MLICALAAASLSAAAQDATPDATPEATVETTAEATADAAGVTLVGSGVVVPVVEALAEASGADLALMPNVTGTNSGFATFCSNAADMITTTRPLSIQEEDTNCFANGVNFLELVVGYNVVAFVSSPEAAFAQCLTSEQVSALFAPSASGQATTWAQVNPENAADPVSLNVPTIGTPIYALLDTLIEGDGLRADASTFDDPAVALDAIAADLNALAVIGYDDALAAGDTVRLLEFND